MPANSNSKLASLRRNQVSSFLHKKVRSLFEEYVNGYVSLCAKKCSCSSPPAKVVGSLNMHDLLPSFRLRGIRALRGRFFLCCVHPDPTHRLIHMQSLFSWLWWRDKLLRAAKIQTICLFHDCFISFSHNCHSFRRACYVTVCSPKWQTHECKLLITSKVACSPGAEWNELPVNTSWLPGGQQHR